MTVKAFSLKAEGSKQLSANFKVCEFACSDGSDNVMIDDALVTLLQKIRDHFKQPTTINSAYRTEAHNKKIGGATGSQHTKGTAADIVVQGTTPLAVAQYAESINAGGIGHYPAGQGNFCHIDTRTVKYRWEMKNGKEVATPGFGGKSVSSQALTVQQQVGLENSTMAYLQEYKFADALLRKLAEAITQKSAKGIGGGCAMQVQQAAGLDDNTMAYLKQYKFGEVLLEKLANAMQ